jgi:acetyl esterase/lipase
MRLRLPGACAVAAAVATTVVSCTSGPATTSYEVRTEVLRAGTGQAVRVWAPTEDAEGPWPMVFALPGISGHKSDLDLLGPALAEQGAVVLATDYRTPGTVETLAEDLACGYRLAVSTADEYGADLGKPVTTLGYSYGAYWMLAGALSEATTEVATRADRCARGLRLPDVVVGLNGCYYSRQFAPFTTDELVRRETDVLVIASSDDRNCPLQESEQVTADLQDAGFDATLTTLPDADHFAAIFHGFDDSDTWVDVPDSPAGERTVEAILDAIEAAS